MKLLSEREDMKLTLRQGDMFNVQLNITDSNTVVVKEEILEDIFVDSLIIFSDNDFHEPMGGIGCYFGSKESVDKFKLVNDIS